MKTITISDSTAEFLSELAKEIDTQDNRATAKPIYFTIRKVVDVGVPDGCGDSVSYYDNEAAESYTEEEAKERAKELGIEFEEYVDKHCRKYDVQEKSEFEGFFLTENGYNEHIRLNGHNIARTCKRFDSYVGHAYRNPEIQDLVAAVLEIGKSLSQKAEPRE